MATAGTLVYSTKLDTKGIDKGLKGMTGKVQSTGSTIKSILGGLGIAAVVSKAIGVINNSLDGAISRFDTMNNFPKVMSNLGIGAEESNKAIKKLSDGLQNVPTTLDEAVLAVQRFASVNSDVEKSTDIFLAVNDAILAGGASTQIQSSALEQLSQAYSKGKPDMMEWRTIQMAMPAQLKQVAIAMGYAGGNTAQLGEDLRSGKVSMNDFIATIIKLDKEGTNGFQSFSKQAENAVGGIGTSLTNAKTAIVRGVETMIRSLDKSLKKAKLGGISGVITKIGKSFENALKKIGRIMEKVSFDKLYKILKSLVPVIGGVVAGFASMSAVTKAMKIGSLVKDIVAMIAAFGPIGIAVGGVVALTSAMVIFSKRQREGTKVTQETSQTLKNYASSVKEAKQAKEEYLNENLGEVARYQDLKNELDGLIDKNGKVKQGYEDRAKFIVSTLNDALGTEISITNGVISNYDKISKSIQDVINKKKAQIVLDAHEKEYANAVKQRTELEKGYRKELAENSKLHKQYNTNLKEVAKAMGTSVEELEKYRTANGDLDTNLIPVNQKVQRLANSFNNVNEKVTASNKTLGKAREEYTKNQSVMKQYEDAASQMAQGNTDAVMKIYDDTRNYTGMSDKEIYNSYQTRINQQKDYISQLKNDKNNYDKSFIDSEIDRANKNIKNLKKEQSQYETESQNTQDHIKGIWNQGMTDLIQDITGKKVTFKQVGKDSFQMYINGVEQGKPMSRKKAKEVTQGMVDELNKGKKKGKTAGTNLIQGVEDGINYKKGSAFSTIASFGTSLLNKLKKSLKEKSPSKATFEMGEFLDIGIIEGIENSKRKVLNTADNFGKDILKKMQSAVTLETGNITANANIKGNSFLNSTTVNSHVVADVYMDRTKVGQAVTPVVAQTIRKAGA